MRRGGFTLLEILAALGLATLVYAMVAYTTLQLNRTARAASAGAAERARTIRAAEQLRWQLRTLFVRGQEGESPTPNPSPSPSPFTASRGSGTVLPSLGNLALYGRRTRHEGQEVLIFRTSRLERGLGATEVGYRIRLDEETREPYLAYRQYPFSDPQGLHPPDDDPDAPWRPLSREIVSLRLEFSEDGESWQREWEAKEAPTWIRATLGTARGARFRIEAVPGIQAPRW